jgi:nicotinate-nucleotide pyrophosphorylase (carboxylating)
LAGTRKTTPGFRLVEKYGMLLGGADPHRHDLSSMTMLKDNHIWACAARTLGAQAAEGEDEKDKEARTASAIKNAIAAAKAAGGFAVKVEVECQSLSEADAAIAAGADIVMLDNFTPQQCREACVELRKRWKGKGREFLIEVSGGLNESNVGAYVEGIGGGQRDIQGDMEQEGVKEGVDIISTSSIHQGVGIVDFSLKILH